MLLLIPNDRKRWKVATYELEEYEIKDVLN